MTQLKLRRAYDPAVSDEGYRVYVDKLWPRGLSHETFQYDVWDKQIAPSDELRHWFHDNPDARWADFESRYEAELAANPALPAFIKSLEQHPTVTLLYSSRNRDENNALVLANYLTRNHPSQFTLTQS